MEKPIEKLARQGDILFIRVDAIPEGLKKAKDNIIAHGEVTGHSHKVHGGEGVALLENESGEKWITADEEFSAVHDEHGPIKFQKGIYQIRRQREYEPEAPRQVAD